MATTRSILPSEPQIFDCLEHRIENVYPRLEAYTVAKFELSALVENLSPKDSWLRFELYVMENLSDLCCYRLVLVGLVGESTKRIATIEIETVTICDREQSEELRLLRLLVEQRCSICLQMAPITFPTWTSIAAMVLSECSLDLQEAVGVDCKPIGERSD